MRKALPMVALVLLACSTQQKEAAQTAGGAFGSDKAEGNTPVAATSAASLDGVAHGAAPPPVATMEAKTLVGGAPHRGMEREAPLAMATGQGSASVRAGEWDDNANYREFQRYIGQVTEPIHAVDVRARRFLVVRDSAGKAVSRCPVTVSDASQHDVTLTTHASGRAILFPYAEGLTGKSFTATARCAEGTASAPVALDDDGDGTVDIKLGAARRNDARVVDVAFVLDTTGSMSEEIDGVRATIQKVARSLQSNQLQVRVGMVEYKDRVDSFVTKPYPFTTNLGAFSQSIAGIQAMGGGDYPEDMNAGIHAAITSLEWSPRAVAKMAFVIADAPPHLDYANDPDYAVSMKDAAHKGIQLFGVAASGMDALGQAVLRQMAQYTGATEMFVLRGGAGPQSTGGGDPIASCGGTQQQYASGKLDELIVAKIKHELAAIDGDAMKIPGLRIDENAKPCADRFD